MAITHILFLAAVQGITEFLPISSSGHLVLAHSLTSLPAHSARLDIALHGGTLLAVIFYLRHDLLRLIFPLAPRPIFLLALASLPALIIGAGLFLLFSDTLTMLRAAAVVAAANIIFTIPLWLADKYGGHNINGDSLAEIEPQLNIKSALLIGLAQGFAFIPGASRAGVTITAARALGFGRVAAGRISMLLAIPLITAATAALFLEISLDAPAAINWRDTLTALIATAIIGFISIDIFMRLLAKIDLRIFIIYRLVLGGALLAFVLI